MALRLLVLPLVLLLAVTLLGGCAGVKVTDYADRKPAFVPADFFSGPMTAHGVVQDRKGRVIRHFNADLVGSWNGNKGVLEEDFVFNDGEKQRRVWTFLTNPDGAITGTAGDVVGEARGRVSGNAFFLKYVLRIPFKGDTLNISIDDRMYLVDERTLISESAMRKYGFRVGTIMLVIRKSE